MQKSCQSQLLGYMFMQGTMVLLYIYFIQVRIKDMLEKYQYGGQHTPERFYIWKYFNT